MSPFVKPTIASRVCAALALGFAIASLGGLAGAAPLAHRAAPARLQMDPAHVRQGGALTMRGSGFPAGAHVILRAARGEHRLRRIGSAVVGRSGSFEAPVGINSHAGTGLYRVTACNEGCRVTVQSRFRVMRAR